MKKKTCKWTIDDDGDTFTTECGMFIDNCDDRFELPSGYDDRDVLTHFIYCPFCGKLID